MEEKHNYFKPKVYFNTRKREAKMFENIGRKIKVLAQIVFWVGVVGSCIAGGVLAKMESPIGLLIMFGGSATALIISWLTYGFGELIDNSQSIVDNTKCIINNTKAVVNAPKTAEPQPYKPVQNKTVTK
ncbi:MAG: hypothetical protein ACI4QL_00575, partial [Candidatus Fimimonas sp.]